MSMPYDALDAEREKRMAKAAAAFERRKRLTELQRVIDLCDCLWPVVVYRNGDGHDPSCPAHRPLGSR